MPAHSPDNSDLILASDVDENGTGDIVFKTGAVERARITAAGAGSGLVAKDRAQVMLTARGLLAENMPLGAVTGQAALVSQRLFGQAFGLRAGDVVTGIVLGCNVAASGTAPTTARFGLADSMGKIVVLSANLNAAASWTVGLPAFPFTAPYTVPTEGGYFGCFVVNGTWSITTPSVGLQINITQYGVAFGSGMTSSFTWAAQTDLPAINSLLTTTTAGGVYYMGLY